MHEKGTNRVGNLLIKNESYERFEAWMKDVLERLYKKKARYSVVEILREIGTVLSTTSADERPHLLLASIGVSPFPTMKFHGLKSG